MGLAVGTGTFHLLTQMPGQAGGARRLPAQDSPVGQRCGRAVSDPGGARAAGGSKCTRRGPPRDARQEETQESSQVREQICSADVCRVNPAGRLKSCPISSPMPAALFTHPPLNPL